MTRVAFMCLAALAINAVLIQTVVPDDSQLKNVVRVGVLAVAGLAMLAWNAYFPRWLLMVVLWCFCLLLLRRNPDQLTFIFVFMLVPALWSVPERRMERAVVAGSLLSLALVFVFLRLGITHNEVLQPRSRSTFGTHGVPFFFNVVYGACSLLILYVWKHRLRGRWLALLACVAGATYLFRETDARGGYYSLLIFVVLLWLVPRLARSVTFRLAVASLPVVFLGVAFWVASKAADGQWNHWLSYRPLLYHRFTEQIGWLDVLGSTSVKHFDEGPVTVDNSWLHLLVGGGLGLFAVVAVLWAVAVWRMFAAGRLAEVAFLMATCFYFNSESILVRIENLFVIYAWYLVLRYCQSPASRSNVSLNGYPAEEPGRVPRDSPRGRHPASQ